MAAAARGRGRGISGRWRRWARSRPVAAHHRKIRAEEPGAGSGGWRATVAEYLTLYRRDTFANLPEDRSLRETELKTVGDKLALPLSVDKLALDDLALKRLQLRR